MSRALRNIQFLRDKVSTRDHNVRSDGVTDDTAALQACIDANPGKSILFPDGTTRITAPVYVRSDNTVLEGSGRATLFQATAGVDVVVFEPTTAGSSAAFLNTVRITGINVFCTAGSAGAGVRFRQCNGYTLEGLSIFDAAEGIVVEGGQMGTFDRFKVFSSTGSALGADSALMHFKQAPVGGGVYQTCYSVKVSNFDLSASKLRETCIRVCNADGLNIQGGYVANGLGSLLRVKAERDNSYVAAVSLANVYLDCVNTSGAPVAVAIPADGFANSYVYGLKIGSGCTIGNGLTSGIVSRKPEVVELDVTGAQFLNFGKWAIDVEGSTLTNLHVEGTQFNNCGDGVTGAIRAVGGRALVITSNVFTTTDGTVLSIGGSWTLGAINGNSNQTAVADITNAGTFSAILAMAGNTSVYSGASSWITDALPSTWTPSVQFGGASVGLTYTARTGKIVRTGKLAYVEFDITLLTKGSSTGAVTIGGLPVTAASGTRGMLNAALLSASSAVTNLDASAVAPGGTSINLRSQGASGFADLTEANFTDTTRVIGSGWFTLV